MRRFVQFLIVGVLASITLSCASVPSLDARSALVYDMVEPVAAIYSGNDPQPMGSAVVVSTDSNVTLLVTAAHVVTGETDLSAVLPLLAPQQHFDVVVIRSVPDYDLALIAFETPDSLTLQPAQLCDYVPKLGEEVWAVGAGAGMLPFPTRGTVSSSHYDFPRGKTLISSILHSAPIIYGNSGGPLYAVRDGEPCVVGINSAVRAAFSGMVPLPVAHIGIAVASSVIREQL